MLPEIEKRHYFEADREMPAGQAMRAKQRDGKKVAEGRTRDDARAR